MKLTTKDLRAIGALVRSRYPRTRVRIEIPDISGDSIPLSAWRCRRDDAVLQDDGSVSLYILAWGSYDWEAFAGLPYTPLSLMEVAS